MLFGCSVSFCRGSKLTNGEAINGEVRQAAPNKAPVLKKFLLLSIIYFVFSIVKLVIFPLFLSSLPKR